ncbi:hypothetical protein [Granulicella arctica]|uniref:hypothetical protein n=1 Tax=Granulicella arctica TaxID=940613 RepID=UPI0021DF9308|nr:hypothetical protein [Granulicella arctica]
MVDIDLLVAALRAKNYVVENVTSVPENAGGYEMTVDGVVIDLEEARALLEADEADEVDTTE